MNQKQQILLDHLKLSSLGFKEYDLIKTLEETNRYFSILGKEVSLFKKHFYLFHNLYLLSDEIKEIGYWLEISALSIKLIELEPLKGEEKANHQLGEYGNEIPELKDFYLDKNNLNLPDKEVEEMLDLFWKKYLALDNKANAIKCLGLQEFEDLTLEKIKKRYNQLASQHHPDKGGDSIRFMQIKEAYEQLKYCF